MNLDIRNEIKSVVVREGKTMDEVINRLAEDYGWSWLESMELARVARARVKKFLDKRIKA